MSVTRTANSTRPDLRDMVIPGLEKLIAHQVLPVLRVDKKKHKIYYRQLVPIEPADTTQRTPDTAPETTFLTATSTDYEVKPVEKRYGLEFHEVDNYGGIDVADLAGGEGAKTSVLETIEGQIRDFTLGGSPTAVAADALIAAVKTAKEAIKRYAGRLVIVCSETAYNNMMTYLDVQDRLVRMTSVQPADNTQLLQLRKTLLMTILEVEDILIGDDQYWAVTASEVNYAERAAVVKIAPEGERTENRQPVWAKDVVYYPQDDSMFEMASFADENVKANKYDATAWHIPLAFNAGACQVLSGIVSQGNVGAPVNVVNTEAKPVRTKAVE